MGGGSSSWRELLRRAFRDGRVRAPGRILGAMVITSLYVLHQLRPAG